jgi:hypothetical protein
MKTIVDREKLADLWAGILGFTEKPQEVFGLFSDRLLDRQASDEDRLPHPGYVGRNYTKGGLLFLAMNPGNGPTNGPDPTEEPHYACLRSLRDAAPRERRKTFDALMAYDESWYPQIRIMKVVVKPVMDGTGHGFDSIAYMNVLKWRTKKSSGLAPLYKLSMKAHTLAQIEELEPGLIVLLGVGVSDVIQGIPEFNQLYSARCITIPRTIGDHRLAAEGLAAVQQACIRFRALGGSAAMKQPILQKQSLPSPTKPALPVISTPVQIPRSMPSRLVSSGKPQADRNRDQAKEFRQQMKTEAAALKIHLNDYILEVDRDNDVAIGGNGPRHAIITFAQKMAKRGATYGDVIGQTVIKGDGKPFKIAEADLLGYVCANGYCKLKPPAKTP